MYRANATILGFNYQFNKNIMEILKSDDYKTHIMLEGTIEDLVRKYFPIILN